MASSAIRFQYSVAMDEKQCIECGTCFGVASVVIESRRKDKKSFYCPNGHPQCYMESEADRLRKQLATEQAARVEANRLRWLAEEARTKAERKLKRTEKRVKNGVCPCCKRTFSNSRLALHLATKHPDFATETKST